MKPFVPAFDALWKGSKASLHNSTRAIFLRLCQEVRDADRDGKLVLPKAACDVDSLSMICPGPREEMEVALREMTDAVDPMIDVQGCGERRVLTVLSWDGWALIGRRRAEEPESTEGRSPDAIRAARYRANRRDRHAGPSRSDRDGVTETVTLDRDERHVTGRDGQRDASVTRGGGTGGASPPDQKRVEERKVDENTTEAARASGPQISMFPSPEDRDGVTETVTLSVTNERDGRHASTVTAPVTAPVTAVTVRRHGKRDAVTAKEHPMPADWTPSDAHRRYAATHALDLETEEAAFRGWAEGRSQVSWNGTFTTRLANAVKFRKERDAQRPVAAQSRVDDAPRPFLLTGYGNGGSR